MSDKEYLEQSEEKIKKAEEGFVSFCKTNHIKFGTKTFYKFQLAYFNGAIAILGIVPARWGVNLISARPVVQEFEL